MWKFSLPLIMAYNEKLTARVREALSHLPHVEEKKMFSGITFMVNGKMCISVGNDRIMCRIDPAIHDNVVERKGVRTVQMKGRDYKGYVYVNEEGIKTKKDFDFWVSLSLEFNKKAKASKPAKKNKPVRRARNSK
jgi:TfoX/Sxy family transcriptional regulator of competence genes